MGNPSNLLERWEVSSWICYVSTALVASVSVRVVLAVITAFESNNKSCWERWKDSFFGRELEKKDGGNHWSSFVLGVLEALSYPVLMATENWSFIGAWLGFKTVAQWKVWLDKREAFNRFLIGKLLIVILSLLLLSKFVKDP